MTDSGSLGRRAQEELRERKILQAALEELAQSDYGGMTIEGVAVRAGVNKTTVYRKWETKAELIQAALGLVGDMFKVNPTTGDFRADLLRIAHGTRDFARSFEGQCLMRVHFVHQPEPELAKLAKEMEGRHEQALKGIFKSAIKRGELAPEVDMRLLLDMMWGAIHARIVMKNETVSDQTLDRLVDMLLVAARPLAEPKARASHPRKKAARR